MARPLTDGERAVLRIVQEHYGEQNGVDQVSWVNDEAVLWVKDQNGTLGIATNLTNLAAWRADGTIDEDELLDWLMIRRS